MVAKVTLTGRAVHGAEPHILAASGLDVATLPAEVYLGCNVRRDALALRMATYMRRASSPLPVSTDWRTKAAPAIARMYLNDRQGCCVIAGKMHSVGVWTANAVGTAVQATDEEVDSQYHGICGPGDRGCMITAVLDVFRTQGLVLGGVRHRIDGYVAVDNADVAATKTAQVVFGANTVGLDLPEAWTQSDVWDTTDSRIVGGHDVTPIDYDGSGVYVASWGRIYRVTWAAWTSRRWIGEYYATLAPDWYASASRSPYNIDAAALLADLRAWGQQLPDIGPGPVGPGPGPGPTPAPGPTVYEILQELLALLQQLLGPRRAAAAVATRIPWQLVFLLWRDVGIVMPVVAAGVASGEAWDAILGEAWEAVKKDRVT